ncbi:MAG: hypothetical protein HYY04_18480 [Chloroflexi bacterium]|nr:hypothetical protein [Chloroflexota bacterium]
MLTERIICHVVERVRETARAEGWDMGSSDELERMIRRRAAEINGLIAQLQAWDQTDDVEYEAISQLLDHLPDVHLEIEKPIYLTLQLPIGEMLRTISATEATDIEGLTVVPNGCPEAQEPDDDSHDHDDGLGVFRRALE